MTVRPLDGITVVTLEHAVAAPFATRQLADLGARVIKVERPLVGDFARSYDDRARGLSSHFVWANRGKESVTLDLKQPRAAELVRQLVLERADVLVQNLAPGAAVRLGLGYEALVGSKPSLIVCDISGYGDSGPYRDRKAYDLLVQAEAGLLAITGTPAEPSKAGISAADIAAAMYACQRVLAALIERGRTGRGQRIDISMLEALTEWMGYPLYYAMDGQQPPPRAGASHATIAPYGPFPIGDGGTVILGLQNEREWAAFCRVVLERADLVDDARFADNARRAGARDELRALIVEAFAPLTVEEVVDRLERAGIASALMNDLADVWSHPQLAGRDRWREIGSPVGPLPTLLPPGSSGDGEPPLGPVPGLGDDTDAVLRAPCSSSGIRPRG